VFENRGLRRIVGPKRDEITEEWRKLHHEERNDLSSSTRIVRVIKPRMRWASHVTHLGARTWA
jgi:cell division protein FtsL